jgi:hypothetical protein
MYAKHVHLRQSWACTHGFLGTHLPAWMHSYMVLEPMSDRFLAAFLANRDVADYDEHTREVLACSPFQICP